MEAADAEVLDLDAGKLVACQSARDLRAKAVVAEKDVADAGHQQLHPEPSATIAAGSTSSG